MNNVARLALAIEENQDEDLSESKELSEDASRVKAMFMANMSH